MPSSRLAEPGEHLALLHHDQVVVRVQGQRALLVEHGLVEVVAHHAQRGEDAVHVAVVVVQPERDVELALDLRPPIAARSSHQP